MSRDPRDRPATASEFGEELRDIQRTHGVFVDEMAHPVELGVEGDAETVVEAELGIGEGGADTLDVLVMNTVVVSLNDGVLAGEVVVGGAKGDASRVCDVAHFGLVEAAGAEELECRLEDRGAAELAFLGGLG